MLPLSESICRPWSQLTSNRRKKLDGKRKSGACVPVMAERKSTQTWPADTKRCPCKAIGRAL